MDDYIIFMEQTTTYQILKSFATEEEADEYAKTVVFDDNEVEQIQEYRWAEVQ
jgi:hypothetical protein